MPYVDAYNHDDNFVAISGDTGEVNMVLLNQPQSNNENNLNDNEIDMMGGSESENEHFSQLKTDNKNDSNDNE